MPADALPPFPIPSDLMVSVSGVRGRIGAGMTPEVVGRFAAAFGAWARESSGSERPTVVLGRDARTSGPMLSRAVTAALQSTGCDVVELGVCPTPTVLLAIRHHGAAGGIIVTASHNPVEWNALKLASGEGMFLDAEQSPRMREYVSERSIPRAAWNALGDVAYDEDAVERHLEAVLQVPYLELARVRERRLKVALDCIRGAGSVILPRLLEEMGCEVVAIHTEPDGRFHREPEPVAANLGELEALVRESGADVGLATDPDADRLSLVSEKGHAIGEDFTLALAAELVLRRRPGAVVTNLSTSRVVQDVATAAGVPFHRAPVGEINVARAMQKADAVIGGEGNGGVILPEVHHTRDAMIAAALVVQLLAEADRPLSELVAAHRPYVIVKDKLPRDSRALEEAYTRLEQTLGAPEADRQDGLRLDWPEEARWVHLRPSGTEPILRIIAEAPSEAEARTLVEDARSALAG